MRPTLFLVSLVGAGLSLGVRSAEAEEPPRGEAAPAPGESEVVLADFDHPLTQANLGWTFGTWERDPADPTQSCHLQVVTQPRLGASGYSVRLDYDVDSLNAAYNGLWVKVIPPVSLSGFQALRIAIKGDAAKGFTTRVKLELKDEERVASYVLEGVESEWVRRRMPLTAFHGIEQLQQVAEFVVVFDDIYATTKVGTIYVDEVVLEREP